VNLFDGGLWIVAVVAVFVIALVAKWLRGTAVEEPHVEGHDAEVGSSFSPADEGEPVDDIRDGDAAEDEGDEEEGDDELAALGVSPDDRLEFLEGLAAHGATALLWASREDPAKLAGFWQTNHGDGTITMPVFTSEKKAYRFTRVLEPGIRAKVSSFEAMPVDAAFLVEGDFEVVVNARTPFETSLTADDRRTLAALAGVEEREPDELAVDEELPEPADDEGRRYDTFGE
jgi:hypothetical protein